MKQTYAHQHPYQRTNWKAILPGNISWYQVFNEKRRYGRRVKLWGASFTPAKIEAIKKALEDNNFNVIDVSGHWCDNLYGGMSSIVIQVKDYDKRYIKASRKLKKNS